MSALRSTRPAAASALPPLVAPTPTPLPQVPTPPPALSPYANPNASANGASNGHYAPPQMTPLPSLAALANGQPHDASQPILPPRPTGRMMTAPQHAGWWKSWPMIVIVLAGIAIVIAVVLMVWPPGSSDKGARTVEPPPAPERMDTNPLPQTHGSTTPTPSKPSDPKKIDIPDDPDPAGALGTQTQIAILDHVCDRLMMCGNDAAEPFCESARTLIKALGKPPAPPTCDAGRRCLARIDRVDCSVTAADVSQLMLDTDCAEALTKC